MSLLQVPCVLKVILKVIARFRANLPQAHAACETIQGFDFFGTTFDAVVAWGVMFHLSEADQAETILKVSQHLRPGGLFLFTAGEEEGIREGVMNDVSFSYISLGATAYRQLLLQCGLKELDEYADEWDNYVFVAKKIAKP